MGYKAFGDYRNVALSLCSFNGPFKSLCCLPLVDIPEDFFSKTFRYINLTFSHDSGDPKDGSFLFADTLSIYVKRLNKLLIALFHFLTSGFEDLKLLLQIGIFGESGGTQQFGQIEFLRFHGIEDVLGQQSLFPVLHMFIQSVSRGHKKEAYH